MRKCQLCGVLVGAAGIEPATLGLEKGEYTLRFNTFQSFSDI